MSKSGILFSSYEFHNVSLNAIESLKRAVHALPEAQLREQNDATIVERLREEFAFGYTEVQWELAKVRREEAMVDLMYVPNTMAYFERRSIMKPGEKYVISVPYTGVESYFQIRPSQWTSSPPRAELTRQLLEFAYSGLTVDVEGAKREFETTKAAIEQHLGWLRADMEGHNSKLLGVITPLLREKRERMSSGEQRLSDFGLPIG
jgi:hypothetical protein